MFYNKHFSFIFLISTNAITFGSEKAPISYLELLPGKGLQPVALAHAYHPISKEEKSKCIYLQEACYTILDNKQDDKSVLVGPLQPCQLFLLYVGESTVVAHLSVEGNARGLFEEIKNKFPDYDRSKITGKLFTNHSLEYDQIILGKSVTFKEIYQNRTQIQELKKNKDEIITIFGLPNRDQIDAGLFKSKKKDFDLGYYEAAELYVLIKIINQKPVVFNTCPIAEKYFGDFTDLSLIERYERYVAALKSIANPAHTRYSKELRKKYTQAELAKYSPIYGSITFYYVEHPNNS